MMHSRKIWSLWDMLKINAGAFLKATSTMERVRSIIRGSEVPVIDNIDENLSDGIKSSAVEHLEDLLPQIESLNASVTALAVRRALNSLESGEMTFRELGQANDDIGSRLCDELFTTHFYVIGQGKASYFDPEEPLFGERVTTLFPSAVYEIDEACKCYALARSTAAVFHLMRTVEIGIRAVATYMGIPDPVKPSERNWGVVLRAIREKIEAMKAGPEKDFCQGVYVMLDAIRDAWRNSTMHVEIKYTEEEAEEILGFVRSFMRRIASRMDEKGTAWEELLS